MAVMLEYRIHFLLAFFILLMLFLIIPMRAETADKFCLIERSQADDLQNKSWFNNSWENSIENRMHILSSTESTKPGIEKDLWIFNDNFDFHLDASCLPHKQTTALTGCDDLPVQKFQTSIQPLVEISYFLTEKFSLELRGHMSRYTNISDTSSRNAKDINGYTFIFGPSVYGGKSGDFIRVYTHFGLGYKLLDNCRYGLFGEGTSSMGTGFYLGLKLKKSDIRFGFNYFKSLAEKSLNMVPVYEKFNQSSMFLLATYNLGM